MSYKKLKSLFAISFIAMGICSVQSCKKYLIEDPITSVGSNVTFADEASAKASLLGVYSLIAGDQGFGKELSLYYAVGDADDLSGPNGTQDDRRGIAHYGETALNSELLTPFRRLYQGIERANQFIKYVQLMDGYSSSASLQRMYGEALTLRAHFYLTLIQNWGDISEQFKPIADYSFYYFYKSDKNHTYDILLDDLKLAEDLVPWRGDAGVDPDERITKGAVKGLRARIALFRGGYSLSRKLPIVDGVPALGEIRRATDYLKYYKIAKDECADIMNSGRHDLNTSFKSLFKDNVDKNKRDPDGEIIYEIANGGDGSGGEAASNGKLGYYGGPDYAYISAPGIVTTITNTGGALIVPTYFYAFDSMDTRRDVTCAPYTHSGLNLNAKNTVIYKMPDGKFRRDWIQPQFSTQYTNVNWPVIRYSDVLLMFAEADNELNGNPSGDAIAAFEKVRKRALGSANIGTTPTTHDDFFTAIVNERMFEFGGEGIRKYDLSRWNLLASKIADTKINLLKMINRQTPYDKIPESMMYPNNSPLLTDGNNCFANSFYYPTPSSTPNGFTKGGWCPSTGSTAFTTTTTFYVNYAQFFSANHSELLPIHNTAITESNGYLTQDYGY